MTRERERKRISQRYQQKSRKRWSKHRIDLRLTRETRDSFEPVPSLQMTAHFRKSFRDTSEHCRTVRSARPGCPLCRTVHSTRLLASVSGRTFPARDPFFEFHFCHCYPGRLESGRGDEIRRFPCFRIDSLVYIFSDIISITPDIDTSLLRTQGMDTFRDKCYWIFFEKFDENKEKTRTCISECPFPFVLRRWPRSGLCSDRFPWGSDCSLVDCRCWWTPPRRRLRDTFRLTCTLVAVTNEETWSVREAIPGRTFAQSILAESPFTSN